MSSITNGLVNDDDVIKKLKALITSDDADYHEEEALECLNRILDSSSTPFTSIREAFSLIQTYKHSCIIIHGRIIDLLDEIEIDGNKLSELIPIAPPRVIGKKGYFPIEFKQYRGTSG